MIIGKTVLMKFMAIKIYIKDQTLTDSSARALKSEVCKQVLLCINNVQLKSLFSVNQRANGKLVRTSQFLVNTRYFGNDVLFKSRFLILSLIETRHILRATGPNKQRSIVGTT